MTIAITAINTPNPGMGSASPCTDVAVATPLERRSERTNTVVEIPTSRGGDIPGLR